MDDRYALRPGIVLHGRYEIKELLGIGGSAYVYQALDRLTGIKTAVKEYFPSGYVTRDADGRSCRLNSMNTVVPFDDGRQYFFREGSLLEMLGECRQFPVFYDAFEENHTAYYVMELMRGRTLKAYLSSKDGKLEEEEILMFGGELLQAITFMHGHGIIHRDICLDNIFLTDDHQVKLFDFGAAVRIADVEQNRSFSVILRSGYAPPEQYLSRGRLGPWTDLYALGAVLYQLCTGKRVPEAIERQIKDCLAAPKTMNPEISDCLNDAVMKALRLDTDERYQSAEEFLEALNGGRESNKGWRKPKRVMGEDERLRYLYGWLVFWVIVVAVSIVIIVFW